MCVCVREFTFEKVVGAQLFSFMVKKDSVDFQVSAHRYIHKGFFTRDFFFPRADMPSRSVFGVFIFAQEKCTSLGEFRAHGTTWRRPFATPNIKEMSLELV